MWQTIKKNILNIKKNQPSLLQLSKTKKTKIIKIEFAYYY